MSIVKMDDENEWVDDVSGELYWIDYPDDVEGPDEAKAPAKRLYMLDDVELSEEEWCLKTQNIKPWGGVGGNSALGGKVISGWVDHWGNFHREDGPALVQSYASGVKDYRHYSHGRLHRDEHPAQYSSDGSTENYYHNASLHRIGGPAYNQAGTRRYYENGIPHRSEGPAELTTDGKPTAWYLNGKLISETEFINNNENGKLDEEVLADGTKVFYKAGTKVKHCLTGPAVRRADKVDEYWRDGQLHRLGDLPAIDGPHIEEYWVNGKLSRDPVLGCARIVDNELLGRSVSEFWVDGVIGTDQGMPAKITYDSSYIAVLHEYWCNGKRHRLDGPAIEDLLCSDDSEYYVLGWPIDKEVFDRGYVEIDQDDAIRSYLTGPHAALYEEPVLHNHTGPAVIWRDGSEEFWLSGKVYSKEDWAKTVQDHYPAEEVQTVVEVVYRSCIQAEFGWTYYFNSEESEIRRYRMNETPVSEYDYTDEMVLPCYGIPIESDSLYFLDQNGDVCKVKTMPSVLGLSATPPIPPTPDDIDLDIEVVEELPVPLTEEKTKSVDSSEVSWGSVGAGALALGLLAGIGRMARKKTVQTAKPTTTPIQETKTVAVPATQPAKVMR